MKKIFVYGLFLSLFAVLSASTASADVIMPNTHAVNLCAKVVNLNDFPDIVLVKNITGPMAKNSTASSIENNICLTAGYKFNSLDIYWTTKDKPTIINASNLLLKGAEWYGGYVDDKNPLVKENIEYSIAKNSDGKLILYKSKQISDYNNGAAEKVETFQNPQQPVKVTPTPTPAPVTPVQPVKLGFWQSVLCFFESLFGKNCK